MRIINKICLARIWWALGIPCTVYHLFEFVWTRRPYFEDAHEEQIFVSFQKKKIVRNTLSFPQWNQRPLHIYVGMDKKPSLPVGSSIIYAHWKNSFVYREMPGDVHPKCYWWSSLGFRAFRGFCAFSTAHGLLLEFLLCSLLNMGHIKLPFCFIFNTKRNFYEMSEQRSSKDHIISVAF